MVIFSIFSYMPLHWDKINYRIEPVKLDVPKYSDSWKIFSWGYQKLS